MLRASPNIKPDRHAYDDKLRRVMQIKLKSLRSKLLAVKTWLQRNARYQNNPLNDENALATATYYINKVDVKDVRRKTIYDHDEDEHRHYYTFRVTIGKPKFRGTVNYTLHQHSLLFNTDNPTSVRIVEDYDFEPWILNVGKAQMGTNSDRVEGWVDDNVYSGHPHVNEYGEPCLGGWANAWSSCVASGNIISLLPVAQSFLNTWTSNDAYYDINTLYRSYRLLPVHFRKLMSMSDFMTHTHLWYKLMRDNSGRRHFSHYKFCRWVASNEEEVSALVYKEGFDFIKLYHCYNGVRVNKQIKHDTKCRMKDKLYKGIEVIRNLHALAYSKVEESLGYPPTTLLEGLVQETMVDKAGIYIPRPWSRPENAWLRSTYTFIDYVSNQIERQVRTMRNDSSYAMSIQQILHFNYNAHKNIKYTDFQYIKPEHVKDGVIYYNSNDRAKEEGLDMWYAVNNILTEFGYEQNCVRFDVGGDKYAESIIDALYALDNTSLSPDQKEEWSSRIAYKALCNYESNLTTFITKGIKNGKEKYKPVVSDNGFRNDSQQNQLSIESF